MQLHITDKMILIQNGSQQPSLAEVTKVTATGRIQVQTNDGWTSDTLRQHHIRPEWDGKRFRVVPFSKEAWSEAKQCFKQRRQAIKEEQERRKQAHAEREEKHSQQIAEVQKLMLGSIFNHTFVNQTLPDGSRLYGIRVPVKEDELEQVKFKVVIVRCIDETDYGSNVKRMYVSSITGRYGRGWTLHSVEDIESDERGLWSAVAYAYNSWC